MDKKNKPELSSIIKATKTVARHIGKNNLIIYESTVYPGCTDEILIPLIQKDTGLKLNKDFFVGYSPERIDPGLSKYKLVNYTSDMYTDWNAFVDCSNNGTIFHRLDFLDYHLSHQIHLQS